MTAIPPEVQVTFTEDQLEKISDSLRLQNRERHWFDTRPVIQIPFMPWSFYLVILAGRNRRYMSKREQRIASQLLIVSLLSGIIILSTTGLVVLYLLKSALGINLFSDFSLGLWDWFLKKWQG
ncbi:hypothetical protein [Sessilibacter corallicola]|uniref:3-phosphoshikimate 1-carboxyvinyltransferase n=1 Tax=Sessilibacter corallicola TaxID=2904075 RepID=A0ABQ0A712_9GAMM|nr:hypothetical protein [Sessilibacter corallicola]MCE2028474.1 hypothetical protein [Sessilibacter corallicola]